MPPVKKGKTQEEEAAQSSGKLWFRNGDVYMGEFLAEGAIRRVKHGQGRYTAFCADSRDDLDIPEDVRSLPVPDRAPHEIVTLDGTWADDAFKEGRIVFASGSNYSGIVAEDGTYVSGGRYTWPDGSWYQGDWQANIMHGNGSVELPDGQKFEGVYRNGLGPGLPTM